MGFLSASGEGQCFLNIQPLLAHKLRPLRDEVEAFFGFVAHELFDDFGG